MSIRGHLKKNGCSDLFDVEAQNVLQPKGQKGDGGTYINTDKKKKKKGGSQTWKKKKKPKLLGLIP